jgi:eukaryotic-like serine/threonine-protein kinase
LVDAPDTVLAGRYRLVNRLAAGGMGSVWEAWDELLQRPVAVKQLLPQSGVGREEAQVAVDRAMREARITARLHHPHAVPVYDVVEHDGRPCLIMQYVPSKSLQEILNDKGVLAPAVVAGIGAEIAGALAAAHEAGIVHRDVKPSNVLITEDGTAKLTDFGVSHAVGDVTLTSVGMVTGTPAYLAPEVARGARSGTAADVFSLGATLYAALEGSPPFGTSENPMALLHRVASGQTIPPRRSGALAPLLVRMLAADPADRPPMIDISRTLAALQADLGSMQDATRPISPSTTMPAAPLAAAPLAAAWPAERATPTAALPVVQPPIEPPPDGFPPDREPGPRRALAAALIAAGVVIVLGIIIALLLTNNNGNSPQAGNPSTPVSRSSAHSPASTARSTSQPPSSTASTQEQSPTESSTPPSPTTQTSPTTQPGGGGGNGGATDAQLAQAITDYYALLPANTDQAWNRLTKSYQHGTARNRAYYQSFWDAIQAVDVANVSGSAPDSAEATLTYTYKDGHVVRERTAFTLVQQGGVLKIDSSTVLSSQ